MTGMHDGADEEGRLPSAAGSHADFSGTGRIVVQARDVRGPVNMFDLGRAEELPVPRQLPRDAAWLVGREEELAFLDRMLPGPADGAHGGAAPTVSVVSGMAGAGKTSLAVHWAHRVIGHYPDGQLYADLRGYASEDRELAARVLDRFLRSLGIPDDRVPSDPQEKECLYRSLLASRSIIVLLDNAASAAQVRPLLPGSGECAVVITSRSTLAGLDGAAYQTLEPLSQADSIRLLRRVLPDTREDGDAELGELAEACAHLPLALRIAAQRAAHRPMVPLAEMLRALRSSEKRWDALSMQNGNEAEAVHSVFAWSYHALLPTTAGFFRLLGGHPGPDISIEAAAALTGTGVERAEVELDRLADAHLVEHSGPRRHRMHDLTAAYARDRMGAQETAEAVDASWRRMFEWYLEAGYRAHRHMDNYGAHFPLEIEIPASGTAPVFVDRAEAAAWCDVEWPNLLAVVNAAIEQGRHELAWKLAATLRFMYHRADRRQAGLALLEAGLRSARLLGDVRAQGIILDSLTQMYSYLRRFPECRAAGEAAIAIWHGLGDHYREAVSRMIGSSESKRGRDWPRLIAMLEDVLAVAEDLGQVRLKAANLGNLGEVMLRRGDLQRASELIEQALEIHRELDWPTGLADTLWNSSRVMRGRGRFADAAPLAEEALEQAMRTSDLELQCRATLELAVVRQAAGDRRDAAARYAQALAQARQENDRGGEARTLGRLAVFHRDAGELRAACELHEFAIEICRETEDHWYLAITLERYADTLVRLGNRRGAHASRTEALGLFEEFDDQVALEARTRLVALLAETPAEQPRRSPAAGRSSWADVVVVTRYNED